MRKYNNHSNQQKQQLGTHSNVSEQELGASKGERDEREGGRGPGLRVCVDIIGHAGIKYVGKCQSCMN